jgi:hypothetical protein
LLATVLRPRFKSVLADDAPLVARQNSSPD